MKTYAEEKAEEERQKDAILAKAMSERGQAWRNGHKRKPKSDVRPPFKPLPLEAGLTEEDVVKPPSEEELADERLGNAMVEKSNKLDKILDNTTENLKLTKEIHTELVRRDVEKDEHTRKRGDK